MEANRIESLPISSAVQERPGNPGPPTNSRLGFFMNSQNIIITGTFILNVRGEHGASGRESPLKSKGEAERYPIPSTSDAQNQQHGFIGKSSTVDELSYTPSQEEKTRDAKQVVATGRKSSKTLRRKGEAVWPPLLQAALIEGLEKYQQEAIRSRAQKSGRFSKRYQFISDYIYETTGKFRTPMQVGSRLQRLRDICKGDTRSQLDCSCRASITRHRDEAPSRMPTFINVQISLQKVLRPCPVPAVLFVDNDPVNPHIIHLSPLSHVDPKIRVSAASSLSYLSGTVEIFAPCTLELQSTFLVHSDNCSTPLHSEIAPLKCLSSSTEQSVWLYSSETAPDFWDTLCSSPDLTRYTILQSVKPIHTESNAVAGSSRASPTVFIAYKFSYQEPGLRTNFNTMAPGPSVYPTSYNILQSARYDGHFTIHASAAELLQRSTSAI